MKILFFVPLFLLPTILSCQTNLRQERGAFSGNDATSEETDNSSVKATLSAEANNLSLNQMENMYLGLFSFKKGLENRHMLGRCEIEEPRCHKVGTCRNYSSDLLKREFDLGIKDAVDMKIKAISILKELKKRSQSELKIAVFKEKSKVNLYWICNVHPMFTPRDKAVKISREECSSVEGPVDIKMLFRVFTSKTGTCK